MEVAESTRSGELPSFLLTLSYVVGEADTLHGDVGPNTIVAGSNDVVHTGLGNDVVKTGYWMEDGETAHVIGDTQSKWSTLSSYVVPFYRGTVCGRRCACRPPRSSKRLTALKLCRTFFNKRHHTFFEITRAATVTLF